jgi:hypothetical protein
MTIAQQISRLLGDDGTMWETQDGRTLDQLAEEYGAVTTTHPDKHYLTRYAFDDGSAIVASDGAWDIEGSTPWSWAGEEDPHPILTDDDKVLLGHLATKDEAGRHFTATHDPCWLHRMERLGWITIHRPRHAATGLRYGPEEWSVEVDESVADWFDQYGNLAR